MVWGWGWRVQTVGQGVCPPPLEAGTGSSEPRVVAPCLSAWPVLECLPGWEQLGLVPVTSPAPTAVGATEQGRHEKPVSDVADDICQPRV